MLLNVTIAGELRYAITENQSICVSNVKVVAYVSTGEEEQCVKIVKEGQYVSIIK
jgi:hypothetical protein